MTDEEREIMGRHAAHWQPLIDSGQMVVFGPVLDGTGSWRLGAVEAEDEHELRAFSDQDPVVTTQTATIETGRMLAGFVRPKLTPGKSSVAGGSRGCPDWPGDPGSAGHRYSLL
jgi:uncharacterized protein YciI